MLVGAEVLFSIYKNISLWKQESFNLHRWNIASIDDNSRKRFFYLRGEEEYMDF